MNLRRKLALEKVIDGEKQLLRPQKNASPITREEIVAAPRFLVDWEDVEALGEVDKDLLVSSFEKLPFPAMWIELDAKSKGGSGRVRIAAYLSNTGTRITAYRETDKALIEIAHDSDEGPLVVHAEELRELCVSQEPPCGFEKLIHSSLNAVAHAIVLINVTGDIVRSESTEVSAKVAAARYRRGKPPLKSYTYIYLNRTPKECSGSGGGAGRALHLVRGHFKRIRCGMRWWRPHFAGSLPEKKRTAYIVKGADKRGS